MTEAAVPDSIERTVHIQAPATRVWDLITQPEHIKRWYAFGGAEVDLRVGGQVSFQWDEHGRYLGVIEALEHPHHFAFRFVPHEADTEPTSTNSTRVEFQLTPEGTSVELRFAERGYLSLAGSRDEQLEHLAMNAGAWDDALRLLWEIAEADGA